MSPGVTSVFEQRRKSLPLPSPLRPLIGLLCIGRKGTSVGEGHCTTSAVQVMDNSCSVDAHGVDVWPENSRRRQRRRRRPPHVASVKRGSERAKGTPMLNFFAEEKSWSFCGVGSVIDDVCL